MDEPHFVDRIHHFMDIRVVSTFLALMNNVALNVMDKCLCGHMLSVLLCIYLELGLLGHMVTKCLSFWGTAELLSKVAVLFYNPTSNI